MDKLKIGEIAREAGIKAALAAAGDANDEPAGDDAAELTCPECGHCAPADEFTSDAGDGVDDS